MLATALLRLQGFDDVNGKSFLLAYIAVLLDILESSQYLFLVLEAIFFSILKWLNVITVDICSAPTGGHNPSEQLCPVLLVEVFLKM